MSPLRSLAAILILGLALAGFSSCSSGPTDPLRSLKTTDKAPKPTAKMASRAGESLEKIGSGYWIFERKCLECHESRIPKDPTNPDWHPVVVGMSWNAGLSESEQSDVMAYLRAAVQ